jgi:hypothetical protein
MPEPADHLDTVVELAAGLRALGLAPVLVGGMALVVLGSRRVTRDFDLVISAPGPRLANLVGLMYDRGLELGSRLAQDGNVAATIANRRVAASRLRVDAPPTAYFYNPTTGLRVDLLFDFPISAATLAERSTRVRIGRHGLRVASESDLLQLKKTAAARRQAPGDAEDIAFLEHWRATRGEDRL